MKSLIFALLVALCTTVCAQNASPAFRQTCMQRVPPSSLTFVVIAAEPLVENRLGLGELRRLVSARQGDTVLGTTTDTPGFVIDWRLNSMADADTGLLCVHVSAAIKLGIAPPVVRIASEFLRGSCPYHAVLDHELGHVQINDAQLRKAAQELNALAKSEFAIKAWFGRAEDIGEAVRTELLTVWIARVEALLQDAHRLHAQHDAAARRADNPANCNKTERHVTATARY